ncbi:Uncharacterised protein [Mycobacteroides abscessus]|nr:Uncharacterised protein [Mycobacteroides abscessus]
MITKVADLIIIQIIKVFMIPNLNLKSRHSQLMVMVMNIINVKMMIITLNNQVSYLDYNLMKRKRESLLIQPMRWMV